MMARISHTAHKEREIHRLNKYWGLDKNYGFLLVERTVRKVKHFFRVSSTLRQHGNNNDNLYGVLYVGTLGIPICRQERLFT